MKEIEKIFAGKKVKKIYGTAGAGKTTYLISTIEELFKQGINPERIAFVSFTKKAVDEMIERVLLKFKQFNKEQFRNFKTIHAICYANSQNKNIMQQFDVIKVAKSMGLDVSTYSSVEEGGGTKQGDRIMMMEALSRLRMVTLEEQWKACNFSDCPLFMVKDWKRKLEEYKKEQKVIDFTDLLQNYDGLLDVDYFFIDEAQDLSPLQWKVLQKMTSNCHQIYIAGDDDQLIYNWAGASVDYILNIKAQEEVILSKSHRLPENIYNLSRSILGRIKVRKPKESTPINKKGSIEYVNSLDNIIFNKDQEYLILVRNRYQIKEVRERVEFFGLPYYLFNESSTDCDEVKAILHWEHIRKGKEIEYRSFESAKKYSSILSKLSKESIPISIKKLPWFDVLNIMNPAKSAYFRRLLENGYKFSSNPKIKLSTIHQAKGGECENVIILTDVSYLTWVGINSDSEHRVWYVAVSRAKSTLTIVREQSSKFYKI